MAIANVDRFIPQGMTVPDVPGSTFSFPTSSYPSSLSQGNLTLASGIPGVQDFNFNFSQAENTAYNNLKAFYDKLLEFAGGKMDLAKRILQYTYEQGMRESSQQFEQENQGLQLAFPTEKAQLSTTQNRRGILESGFGNTERENLAKSQNLRQLEVNRALENRTSNLQANLGFGNEQEQRTFGETQNDLERQRQKEAGQMANQQYAVKSAAFQAELSKGASAENRRVQTEANRSLSDIYAGQIPSGTSTGSVNMSNDKAFRTYMAEHGLQGQLDRATNGGTTQGTSYYNLKKQYGF